MAMPLCGTFHYCGTVPDDKADRESGAWRLQELLLPPSQSSSDYDQLRDNRLVGLQPTLRVRGGEFVLTANRNDRAQVESATLSLSSTLADTFQGGDVLTLVRSNNASIGLSLLRSDVLVWAVGAVTIVPIGRVLRISGGPKSSPSSAWPSKDTWLDVNGHGLQTRLRDGDRVSAGDFVVSVVHACRDGIPGKYEIAAVSNTRVCTHGPAEHSARLLAGPYPPLKFTNW